MFAEYDVVRPTPPSGASWPQRSRSGTVLLVYQTSPMSYEVEAFDESGNSLGLATLKENELALLTLREEPPNR
jgi:hypothetical protein